MKLQTRHGLTYVRNAGHVWFDGQVIEVEDEEQIVDYRLAGFVPVDENGQPLDLPPVSLRIVEPIVVGPGSDDGLFDTDSLNVDTTISRVLTATTPRKSNR